MSRDGTHGTLPDTNHIRNQWGVLPQVSPLLNDIRLTVEEELKPETTKRSRGTRKKDETVTEGERRLNLQPQRILESYTKI